MRSAIAALDKHRQELTSGHLHLLSSTAATNMDDIERRCAIALGRASVTTDFNNSTSGETNAGGSRGHRGDQADPGFHELAALQLVSPYPLPLNLHRIARIVESMNRVALLYPCTCHQFDLFHFRNVVMQVSTMDRPTLRTKVAQLSLFGMSKRSNTFSSGCVRNSRQFRRH